MASSSYSDATFCGAGAQGKTGEELLDHFREFVGKVWESESPTGMVLVLRPKDFHSKDDELSDLKDESDDNVVYFYTLEQLKQVSRESHEHFELTNMFSKKSKGELNAVLVNFNRRVEVGSSMITVSKSCTKATVVKWLAQLQLGTRLECVVCYEKTGDVGMSCKCRVCATLICLQCFIDIALDGESVEAIRAVHCPLCGDKMESTFHTLCHAKRLGLSLTEAHEEFVHFWYNVSYGDFSSALRCDFEKMTAKMRQAVEVDFKETLLLDLRLRKAKLMESRTRDERLEQRHAVAAAKRSLKTYPPLLRRALRGKAPVLRSADDSIATAAAQSKPVRVRSDHCANCQKVFWDKREKKRAPKCPKCKRVAYCSGACRKKHKRAHSLQCVAGAKAKKKKKAAAKAAKLYGP